MNLNKYKRKLLNPNFGQPCEYADILCQERSGCSGCEIYIEVVKNDS